MKKFNEFISESIDVPQTPSYEDVADLRDLIESAIKGNKSNSEIAEYLESYAADREDLINLIRFYVTVIDNPGSYID